MSAISPGGGPATEPRPRRVASVILAAGRATRAGVTKQLLQLAGKPLLQHVLDNAAASRVDDIVIVLGHDQENIRRLVDTGSGRVAVNPAFESGQGSSLAAGIEALDESVDAAIILLGDQPGIRAEIIDAVIAAYVGRGASIVIPTYLGQRGNPVLFDRSLFQELQTIAGDTGARLLLGKRQAGIQTVPFDFAPPPDIDTMDDYQKMVERQFR